MSLQSLAPFFPCSCCLFNSPFVSKAVAFSLWSMGHRGSLRCLCDKHKIVTNPAVRSQPIISWFSAQCSSASFRKCFDICKRGKIESHCSQGIHSLPTPLASLSPPLLTVLPFVPTFSSSARCWRRQARGLSHSATAAP